MTGTLRLPTEAELQAVTDLVTGGNVPYASLQPDQRAKVIELAIQADISDSLAAISSDMQGIGEWFRVSRVWEGA